MGAPKGNQFWKVRTTHGKDKLFTSPEILWEACCEYFEWIEENPLWEVKAFAYQGVVTQEKIPKMRAMTIDALTFFLRIDHDTWRNWKNDKEYIGVITEVERIIKEQKFGGAAADLLNANIIARDLGLVDKKDHSSSDGSMSPKAALDFGKLSKSTIEELMAARDESEI